MTDKILEAVKALGGDLRNTENYSDRYSIAIVMGFTRADGEVDYYQAKEKSTSDHRWFVACTIDEFNTYAEQWLKEAYMHNAAIDLDWDIENRDCKQYISNCSGAFRILTEELGYVDICTKQEFIDYCNANKPRAATAPVFTQAMADTGELPPVGSICTISNEDGRYICDQPFDKTFIGEACVAQAYFKNNRGVEMVAVSNESGDCACYRVDMISTIKSPRDKAIEEMLETAIHSENDIAKSIIYGACAKLYDAGCRKLTPEQRKEFDL